MSGEAKNLVPKKGLEPPHPCGYMDLNHARLPIPPLRPVDYLAQQKTLFCLSEELHVYFTGTSTRVKHRPTCGPTPNQQLAYRNHPSDNTQTYSILERGGPDRAAGIPLVCAFVPGEPAC